MCQPRRIVRDPGLDIVLRLGRDGITSRIDRSSCARVTRPHAVWEARFDAVVQASSEPQKYRRTREHDITALRYRSYRKQRRGSAEYVPHDQGEVELGLVKLERSVLEVGGDGPGQVARAEAFFAYAEDVQIVLPLLFASWRMEIA